MLYGRYEVGPQGQSDRMSLDEMRRRSAAVARLAKRAAEAADDSHKASRAAACDWLPAGPHV